MKSVAPVNLKLAMINVESLHTSKLLTIRNLLENIDILCLVETWHYNAIELEQLINTQQNTHYTITTTKPNRNKNRNGHCDGIMTITNDNTVKVNSIKINYNDITLNINNNYTISTLYLPPKSLALNDFKTIINRNINNNIIVGDLNFVIPKNSNSISSNRSQFQPRYTHIHEILNQNNNLSIYKPNNYKGKNHIIYNNNSIKSIQLKETPTQLKSAHKTYIEAELKIPQIQPQNEQNIQEKLTKRLRKPLYKNSLKTSHTLLTNSQPIFKRINDKIKLSIEQNEHPITRKNIITSQNFTDNITKQISKILYNKAKEVLGTYTTNKNKNDNGNIRTHNTNTPHVNHTAIKYIQNQKKPIQENQEVTPPTLNEITTSFNALYNPDIINVQHQQNHVFNTDQAIILANKIDQDTVFNTIKYYPSAKSPGPDQINAWLLKLYIKPNNKIDNNNNSNNNNNQNENNIINANNNNEDINNENNNNHHNNNNNNNQNNDINFNNIKIDISEILTNLFKLIIQTNTYPTQWKTTNTVLIPKTNPPSTPNDFRGISLSNMFDRFYTMILKKAINKSNPKLLKTSPYQAANKSNYSAQLQILTLQAHIETLSPNDEYALISIDFSKAFDKVNRNTLYKILKIKGWNDTYISLIKTLLENRKTHIKYNNSSSKLLSKKRSIEQGNGLSGILFDIFVDVVITNQIKTLNTNINNIQNRIDNISLLNHNTNIKINDPKSLIMGFADDNNAIVPIQYIPAIMKTMSIISNILELGINTDKSQITPIRYAHQIPLTKINNMVIPQKPIAKVLGFYIGLHGINTDKMIEKIEGKIEKGFKFAVAIGIRNHPTNSLHPKAKLNIYKQYIQTLYEYFLTPTLLAASTSDQLKTDNLLKKIYNNTNKIIQNITCSNPNNNPILYSILGLSNIYQRTEELKIRFLHQTLKTAYTNPIHNYLMKINQQINVTGIGERTWNYKTLNNLIKPNIIHILHISPSLVYYWFPNLKLSDQQSNKSQNLPNTYTKLNRRTRTTKTKLIHPTITNIPPGSQIWKCCPPDLQDSCPTYKLKTPNYNAWSKKDISNTTNTSAINVFTKYTNPTETKHQYYKVTRESSKSALNEYIGQMRIGYFHPKLFAGYKCRNPYINNNTSKLFTSIPISARNHKTLVHTLLSKYSKDLIYRQIKVITKSANGAITPKYSLASHPGLDPPIKFSYDDTHLQYIQQYINTNLPTTFNMPLPTSPSTNQSLIALINHLDFEIVYIYLIIIQHTLTNISPKVNEMRKLTGRIKREIVTPITTQTIFNLINKHNNYLSKQKKQLNPENLIKYIKEAHTNANQNVLRTSNIARNNALNQSWATPQSLIYPLSHILDITHELCAHAINSMVHTIGFSEFKSDSVFGLHHDLLKAHTLDLNNIHAYINPPFHQNTMKKFLQYTNQLISNQKLKFLLIIAPANHITKPPHLHQTDLVIYDRNNFAFLPPQYPMTGLVIRNGGVPFKIAVSIISRQENFLQTIPHQLNSIFYILKMHDKAYNEKNYNPSLVNAAKANEKFQKHQHQTLLRDPSVRDQPEPDDQSENESD